MKKALWFCLFLLAISTHAEPKPILAVLDFGTEGLSSHEMKTIISLLTSAIFNLDLFTVIDVAQRESVLKEIEFSSSNCTDETCQLRIGKLLSADRIVIGRLGKVGTKYVFSSKMLETETAKTIRTADGVYSDVDAIVADIGALAGKLAGAPSAVKAPEAKAVEPEKAVPKETAKAPILQPLQPLPPPDWKLIGTIAGFTAGLGCAGGGGFLLYDAVVNAGALVSQAWTAYDTAKSGFDNLYSAYISSVDARKIKLIEGIALGSAGLLLTGLGVFLAVLPGEKIPVQAGLSFSEGRAAAVLRLMIR